MIAGNDEEPCGVDADGDQESAIHTSAIAASTIHGERACNCTSATQVANSSSQPSTSAPTPCGKCQRRESHAGINSTQNAVASTSSGTAIAAGQPAEPKPAAGTSSSTSPSAAVAAA